MSGQPPPYNNQGYSPYGYPGQSAGAYAPPPAGYAPPPGACGPGYAPPPGAYGPGYTPPPGAYGSGYVPPPAGYPQPVSIFVSQGGICNPPQGVAQGGTYYPQPAPDRPHKEHCFYLKSNMSQMVMEVEKGTVDPGTRVVMATYNGQGQDGQLWFEDYNTGTIKSRLSLLCLDVQDHSEPYRVVKSPGSIPPQTICLGKQGGKAHYSAVAHTQWGSIPGKALLNQCWYSYGGAEYCTPDFSWIVAQTARLVRNTGSEPSGAVGVGHQNDTGSISYAVVARSQWGTIPGRASGNTCWYGNTGKEHYTSDFDWILAERNMVVVNPHIPGKDTQLWLRAGTAVQNRQDTTKVLQHADGSKGSLVYSTVANSDPRQQWTFQNHGTIAPPAGIVKARPIAVSKLPPPPARPARTAPPAPPAPPAKEPTLLGIVEDFAKLVLKKTQRRHFFIRSEMHNKLLDVQGGNTKAGTMAIMFPKKSPPTANQLWYTDEQGIIRSKMTDFCLQPSGHGIWFQPFTNKPNQMWIISDKRMALKSDPKLCLAIRGAEQKDGALVCQSPYKGSANQHWAFDYVD